MTQKEYKEKIEFLEDRVKELTKEVECLTVDKSEHELLLQNYYHVSSKLICEQTASQNYENENRKLREIIERYEKMLDKVSFQVIDGNRY